MKTRDLVLDGHPSTPGCSTRTSMQELRTSLESRFHLFVGLRRCDPAGGHAIPFSGRGGSRSLARSPVFRYLRTAIVAGVYALPLGREAQWLEWELNPQHGRV